MYWAPRSTAGATTPAPLPAPSDTVTRVELHDHGAKTRMTLSDGPYPGGGGHAEAGWSAAFDKLATLVSG